MSIQVDSNNRSVDILNSVDGLENLATALNALVDSVEPSLGEVSPTPTADSIQDRLKRLEDSLGLAIASPAANTIHARLKEILTALGGGLPTTATTTNPTVTTTAAVVAAAGAVRSVRIQNDSTATVYIGHSSSLTSALYAIKLNAGDGASLDYAGDIYAIVASGTAGILVTQYS
jgi:hypothetical protein